MIFKAVMIVKRCWIFKKQCSINFIITIIIIIIIIIIITCIIIIIIIT